ncbi:MAG: DUF5036 family protein [Coprobacter sp.]|nr:DUF5036 family protein [Coprobacter sp.]
MKKYIFFLYLVLFPVFATVLLSSCSKEDEPDAAGIRLKMRNYDNGDTRLDNYIHITSANNFAGGEFVDVGKKKLSRMSSPVTEGRVSECAVVPGHGYWAYTYNCLRKFPSRKEAFQVGYSYYKIHVSSWIEGTGDGIIGAEVEYTKYTVDNTYEIPSSLTLPSSEAGASATFTLAADPKGDVEWEGDDTVKISISGKKITLTSTTEMRYTTWGYLRVKDTYCNIAIYR